MAITDSLNLNLIFANVRVEWRAADYLDSPKTGRRFPVVARTEKNIKKENNTFLLTMKGEHTLPWGWRAGSSGRFKVAEV